MHLAVDQTLKERLHNALDTVIELHRADFGHIQLYDPEQQSLRIAVHRGFCAASLSRFERAGLHAKAPFLRVLQTGEPLAIGDFATHTEFMPYQALAREAGFRALHSAPLQHSASQNHSAGVLTTCFREPRQLSPRIMRITLRLARQTAELIEARRIGVSNADDELRNSQNRLRTLVEGIPQLVWRSVKLGEWTWCSPQWSAFTGLSAGQSFGLGWLAALHPDDREAAMAAWSAAETRQGFEADLRILNTEQGKYRWFQSRAAPLRDARGESNEWLGTSTDVEDQFQARAVLTRGQVELEALVAGRTRELQEAVDALQAEMQERELTQETLRQSQKLQAVGQLTGGIAHDFNNMLQGISSSLEIVQRRVEQQRTPEAMRFLDAARKSVERAAGLTQRLLTFARKQNSDAKPVNLDDLALGLEELIRRTVGPSVQVEMQMNDGGWLVQCDENQMENALLNLAINARDAMPEGGTLTILTEDVVLSPADVADEDEAAPGPYSVIAVRDTGTGMSPEVMARALEPFFTTKTMGQGTGLGLSQIYGFVRQSKGLVRIDSVEGQGTTIRLYLPRFDSSGAQPAASGDAIILLVEDDAALRGTIAAWLRDLGYQVIEAADGASAIRLLRWQDAVDALLADIRLPGGLNGREVAEAARARHPELPVLFINADPGSVFPEGLPMDANMTLITKPFALDVLVQRLQAMLKR